MNKSNSQVVLLPREQQKLHIHKNQMLLSPQQDSIQEGAELVIPDYHQTPIFLQPNRIGGTNLYQ